MSAQGATILRRCRETGLMVGLYHHFVDDAPWTIICEEHAFSSDFEHRYGPTGAEAFLSHPASEGWCEECSGSEPARRAEVAAWEAADPAQAQKRHPE